MYCFSFFLYCMLDLTANIFLFFPALLMPFVFHQMNHFCWFFTHISSYFLSYLQILYLEADNKFNFFRIFSISLRPNIMLFKFFNGIKQTKIQLLFYDWLSKHEIKIYFPTKCCKIYLYFLFIFYLSYVIPLCIHLLN